MKKIRIEYCTSWGYVARAVALSGNLLDEHKNRIEELKIIPSAGGVFEVYTDDKLIFSKKNLNRFPEVDEVENLIRMDM